MYNIISTFMYPPFKTFSVQGSDPLLLKETSSEGFLCVCVYIAEFAAFQFRILSAFLRLSRFRRNIHQARALLA